MITINKAPSGIYAAYEDSFIEFESDLANNDRAEITILGYNEPFLIYPDFEGKYLFNLVEFSKALFNKDSFRDEMNEPLFSQFSERKYYESMYININVYNSNSSDSLSSNFKFYRGIYNDDTNDEPRLLIPKFNDFYHFTYFEGYPYFFESSNIETNKIVKIKNKNNNYQSTNSNVNSNSNSIRFYLQKTTNQRSNLLINKKSKQTNLIFEARESKSIDKTEREIKIKRVDKKCGVYLKWYNSYGGYSFYLFDNYFDEDIKVKILDEINTNQFKNAGEKNNFDFIDKGKEYDEEIKLKTSVDRLELKYIKDLFYSPHVQMYSKTKPFQRGEFVDVKINGRLKTNNKKDNNEINLKVLTAKNKTMTY